MTTYSAKELEQEGKLLKYDDVMESLAPFEDLGKRIIQTDGTDRINFTIADLPEDFKDLDGSDILEGTTMSVGESEYLLSKDAFTRVLQQAGLRPTYAQKTPGNLLAEHLDYHYTHSNTKADQLTVLSSNGRALELVPGNATAFSNYQVVEAVAGAAASKFGVDTSELFFDYKIERGLDRFAGRLIVPDTHTIRSTRHSNAVEDIYSTGIFVQNSMVADLPKTPTTITGYLFAYWCVNGATTTHAHAEEYSKRDTGANWEDVYEWLQMSTLHSLEMLPEELRRVQQLTEIDLTGELATTSRELFRAFGVPISAIPSITDALIESDDTSAYGLMQAITQSANDPDMSDSARTKLMAAGGGIAHALVERCGTCHRLPI